MLVRLLGGVEVAAADGWTRAGPPKRACVLAALALSPGAPVSLGDLIRRVWGDDPPESAVTVLYGHMTWLRTLLRDCADMSIRRSTGGGYLLEIDAEQIDLYAARSLAKRARRQSETGRHGLSVSLWRQVCDLARGEALAGVSGDWAAEVRAGFRREHLSMLAERFDAELAAGQHAAVVGELAELAARHPADESMTGRLMTALYRCGRPAEALDAFSQIRQRLADELGVDPSDQLRKLHLRILQQDPGLEHVEDETDAGPFADEQREADAAPPVPAELPADAAGFAGRDAQVEQLCVQAAGNGVLVVDGMAGVGKTALAVHVARRLAERYPDGQLFVDLHGFSEDVPAMDPAQALDRMLRSLGVADAEIPDGRQARSAALRTALAGRRVLVVLDNAVDAGQVRPLLPGEPECLAIVTSRRRLVDLVDAHPMSLEVLTPADAAALFADAAATSSRPIAPDRAVAEIVEACGRLPLAVRIAASRLRNRPAWTPADLLSRLSRTDRTLEALNADSRGVAAAFSLSYDELDAEHRRLFGLLAAGPGPEFDAEAAATLADRPLHAAEKMVENLVDGHLLMTDAPGRYHFHDLLRQYAVTVADQVDAQARADALTRLLNAYAVTTRAAVGLLDPHLTAWPRLVEPGHVAGWSVDDRPQAVSWFAAEQANLTLAVEECLERQLDGYAAELCAALSCYLEFHGHGEDRVAVERNGLAAARRMRRVDLEAYFSNRLGLSQLRLGRFSEAIDWLEAALRLWSDVGDPRGTAATLNNLGNLHASRGDYLASIDAYERVVETATSAGLKELEAQGRYNLSWPLLWLDRLDEARACLDGASAAFRELGHEREEARVLFHLGLVAWRGGDFAEALRLHERVLAQCRDYGEPDGTAWSHAVIADDLRGLGRGAEALDHCQLALDTLDGLNQPALEARILHRLGAVQQTLDDRDSALESHHAAAGIAARLGARHLLAEAERGVAEALRAAGDESGARRYLERALDYFAAAGLSEADEVRRELAVDDR